MKRATVLLTALALSLAAAAAEAHGDKPPAVKDIMGKLNKPTAAFVHESIVNPNKQVEKGYQPNIMPQDFGQKLSKGELDALVDYILKGQE